MDFLDKIVIPPSQNHVLLVKYILTISFVLLIPYLGMVLGSSFLSVYFNRLGRRTGNAMFSRFAKDVIEKLTFTKNAEFALGIIPMLSITFGYAQLLFEAKTITMSIMALSVALVTIGLVTVYRYRATFVVEDVLNSYKKIFDINTVDPNNESVEQIKDYEENLLNSGARFGSLGSYILLTGAYIFIGSIALASNPPQWGNVNNILQIIFSWNTIFSFMYLLASAGVVTGGGILFFFFKWNGGLPHIDENYGKFVKSVAGRLTFGSVIFLPLLMLIKFLYLPGSAQSQSLFIYMLLTFVVVLILCNLVYSMVRNSDTNNVTAIFVLIYVVFTLGILNDQIAFGSAITDQTRDVIAKSEELEKEVKLKTMNTSEVDPDAIFNSKCIACHRFDVKLVGPPYDQTVPTFNGDVQKLADFIFSPSSTPINAGYPAMPNQGLKKKEALAMAKWLMEKVGKK